MPAEGRRAPQAARGQRDPRVGAVGLARQDEAAQGARPSLLLGEALVEQAREPPAPQSERHALAPRGDEARARRHARQHLIADLRKLAVVAGAAVQVALEEHGDAAVHGLEPPEHPIEPGMRGEQHRAGGERAERPHTGACGMLASMIFVAMASAVCRAVNGSPS